MFALRLSKPNNTFTSKLYIHVSGNIHVEHVCFTKRRSTFVAPEFGTDCHCLLTLGIHQRVV